jgi:hypothetical protein
VCSSAGGVLAVVSIAIIPYALGQSRLAAFAVVAGFVGGYVLS